MAVPNVFDVKNFLNQLEKRLNKNINNIIATSKKQLDNFKQSYVLTNPMAAFEIREQKLDNLINDINNKIKHIIDLKTNKLITLKESYVIKNPDSFITQYNNTYELMLNKLNLLNPLNILSKGYSVVKKDDKVIKDIKNIKVKDKISIRFHKGNIDAIIERINRDGR